MTRADTDVISRSEGSTWAALMSCRRAASQMLSPLLTEFFFLSDSLLNVALGYTKFNIPNTHTKLPPSLHSPTPCYIQENTFRACQRGDECPVCAQAWIEIEDPHCLDRKYTYGSISPGLECCPLNVPRLIKQMLFTAYHFCIKSLCLQP